MRQLAHDKRGINAVSLAECRRRFLVESKQHHPDQKKQRELKENRHPRRQQRRHRLFLIASREQALHDQLIGSVTRGGEKSSANDASPKRIRLPESRRKIKHLKLAAAGGEAVNCVPAARNQVDNGEQSD